MYDLYSDIQNPLFTSKISRETSIFKSASSSYICLIVCIHIYTIYKDSNVSDVGEE